MIGYGFNLRKTGIPPLQMAAWFIWAGLGRECKNPLRVDYAHLPLREIDDKSGYPSPQFEAIMTLDLDTMVRGEIPDELRDRRLAQIKTPTYTVGGWYDVVLTDTLDTWIRLKKTQPDLKLMIGPWHHNLCDMEQARIGKVPTDDVEVKRYYEQMEMFFAHHLKGEENEVSRADAPVKLYVMGKNVWRNEYEWPLERTEYRSLYLHSSGNAGTDLEDGVLDWTPPQGEQAADKYAYDPLNPVSWWAGFDLWTFLDDMSGREDVEDRDDVLVYTTPALEEDLEVTGEIAATVYAASDAEDTDFVVTLVDVHPDGHAQYLSSGIIRARYRNGVERPELIEPGKVYKYEIRMNPTSNVFLKAHRIRIEVTSSDFDRYARNQNIAAASGQTAEVRVAHQTILHSGDHLSHVVLPVIPASADDEKQESRILQG
jgi:putative CocE/NonD family hydrolase